MRVEREIAVFAFPFAAGIIAAVILGTSLSIINPTYHITAQVAALLPAVLLLHPDRRNWNEEIQWGIIGICALFCGIFIGISGTELQISHTDSEGILRNLARSAGDRIKVIIDGIPFEQGSTNGIIKALLTGDRSGITQQTAQVFRDSGASHILALSGLHLGIIYGVLSKIFSIGGNSSFKRRMKSVIIIIACIMYTLATGAGASITRACMFIVLKETAELTGRNISLKGILATSLALHLAFDPMSATDVGFQLSYAAMMGIAFLFPVMKRLWKNEWPGLKWMWESLSVSISCQITTGPLAYYYFGTFPQYFLLTNLLAIPLAAIMIPSAILTIIMCGIGYCPEWMINITEWLTQTMIDSLTIIASM